MKQPITGYHQDEHDDWVAELACGHLQHGPQPALAKPAMGSHIEGRNKMLGYEA